MNYKSSIIMIVFCFSIGCTPDESNNVNPNFTNVNINFTGDAYGCGNFFVYKINSTNDAAILVRGKSDILKLGENEKTFDLENVAENDLNIKIEKYDGNPLLHYCNDVRFSEPKLVGTWVAIGGNIKILLVENEITVIIENVILRNESTETLTVDYLEFNKVLVGWLPG